MWKRNEVVSGNAYCIVYYLYKLYMRNFTSTTEWLHVLRIVRVHTAICMYFYMSCAYTLWKWPQKTFYVCWNLICSKHWKQHQEGSGMFECDWLLNRFIISGNFENLTSLTFMQNMMRMSRKNCENHYEQTTHTSDLSCLAHGHFSLNVFYKVSQ